MIRPSSPLTMLLSRHTRRREFITLFGGAVALPLAAGALPLAAGAQQPERMRRIGILLPAAADDPEYQARVGAFLQALGQLGWIIGRNVRIDYRWGAGDLDRFRKYAAELVALSPGRCGAGRVNCWRVSAGKPHRAHCVRHGY